MISLYGLLGGLLGGWLRGGSIDTLADVRLRLWGLCVGALVLHHLLPVALPDLRGGAVVHEVDAAVYYAALVVFGLANRDRPGAYLLLGGAFANALPTLVHGGRMPVWTATLGRIGATRVRILFAGGNWTHIAVAHPGGIGWLGDVLATPAPLPADVVSVGDLAIAAGVAVFLAVAMKRPRPDAPSLPS